MKFIDPIAGVGDEVFADGAGVLPAEINRGAPIGRVAVGEVVFGEIPQIVPVRSQVVVYDVEDHAEADRMGAVDEASEVVGRAVEARRREQIHAVVAPAEFSWEIGHRHDLYHGYSQMSEFVEFTRSRGPRAFTGERPDVHFINDLTVRIHPTPVVIGPFEPLRIYDLRRAMRAFGLITRSRVGVELIPLIQTKAVKSAVAHRSDHAGEITLAFRRQFECSVIRAAFGPTLDHDCDRATARRPNAKICSSLRQNICPDMKWARAFIRHLSFVIGHWSFVICHSSLVIAVNIGASDQWLMTND